MGEFKFLLLLMVLITLIIPSSSTSLYAADLTSAQLPSAQSVMTLNPGDAPSTIVLRDAGLGLGVGTVTGLLFSLMSGGSFSQTPKMIHSEAFGTALFTGLVGGVITGLWQAKKIKARHVASVDSSVPTAPSASSIPYSSDSTSQPNLTLPANDGLIHF